MDDLNHRFYPWALIHLLHLGGLGSVPARLELGHLLVLISAVLVDAEAQLDHAVQAAGEGVRLVKAEPGHEHRRVEEQPYQVLHCFVLRIRRHLLDQLPDNGMIRVYLHGLL